MSQGCSISHVLSDAEAAFLIRGARARNKASFARLYELYASRVYRYLGAILQNEPTAEDLCADVFVRLLEHIDGFQPGASPAASLTAWIFRIAHNRAMDHLRASRPLDYIVLDEQDEQADPATTSEVRRIEMMDLDCALAELTPEQRAVVVLRFQQELSIALVAAALNKTEGAVKALQARALRTLARWLGEQHERRTYA